MKQKTQVTIHPLAQFAATLQWSDVPAPVQRRTEDLWVDWFGSVLAGCRARPVASITRFALSQGPASGPAEVIGHGATSSPMMAALANAAASHVAEQDDVHNGSVFHPAAVVFPPALAVAQSIGASGAQLMAACVAGYEVGIRVGEFLGRSHYKVFHTTATAGTLAAAAAVGRLLELTPAQMQHAFGSAGMSSDANPAKLTEGLGTRWATAETSFKWHASCRHTHPAADALQQVMREHGLAPADIAQVTCHVHQGAIDVLGPVVSPTTVHQSKFSMGTVLALAARFGHAGLTEFDEQFLAPDTVTLREKVRMVLDPEVDAAYPQRWIGKVTVQTTDGRTLAGRVEEPKGDPGNTLSREELTAKALRLAAYGGAVSDAQARAAVQRLWQVQEWPRTQHLLG